MGVNDLDIEAGNNAMSSLKRLLCSFFERVKGVRLPFFLSAVMLVLVILAYYCLWLRTTAPISGWWNIEDQLLIADGAFPYRDFHYHVPPLNLVIENMFWSLSFGNLLAFRCWYLAEKLVIIVLLYWILDDVFGSMPAAWIASLFGSIVGSGAVFDMFGDYNQTVILWGLLIVFQSIQFAKRQREGLVKNSYTSLRWAGFFLGLLLLTKQSHFVFVSIGSLLALIAFCWCHRDKRLFRYCANVCVAMAIPIGVSLAIIVLNGAWDEFIGQVWKTSSKGSLSENLISTLVALIKPIIICPAIALMLSTALRSLIPFERYGELSRADKLRAFVGEAMCLIVSFGLIRLTHHGETVMLTESLLDTGAIFVVIAISVASVIMLWKAEGNAASQYLAQRRFLRVLLCMLLICLVIIALLVCMAGDYSGISETIYQSNGTSVVNLAVLAVFDAALVLTIWNLVKGVFRRPSFDSGVLFLSCFVVAYGVTAAVTGGTQESIGVRTLFLTFPFVFCWLLSKPSFSELLRNAAIVAFCAALIIPIFAQKAVDSYSWWGWKEEPVWVERSAVDVPGLEGFLLTEDERTLYEEGTRIIERGGYSNPRVFGFPHTVMFNILTNNVSTGTSIPILFYDVCGDNYAESAASQLEQDLPEFVVWVDMPGCLSTHEALFRGGERLGQRAIQDWFSSVRETSYTLVGQFGGRSFSRVFIYRKNDGLEGYYTYFDGPIEDNVTAISGSS